MREVASLETNRNSIDHDEVDQNNYDAPSSTDNSDNEGVNHEANGDSDNADNESSNNENDNAAPVANALRNPDYNVVNNEDHDDTNNSEHDSDNEEEEAHSGSQPVEYDWNYAEQDSISDSDDYDWNFGYEEDQARTNNSNQNTNTTAQTTNAEKDDSNNFKSDGASSSDQKDSAGASNDSQNAEKSYSNSGKPNEANDPADISCQSFKPDELGKTENDNLKLIHTLELDESKNAKADDVSSAASSISSVGLDDIQKTQNDQTTTDDNKTKYDAEKDNSELKSGNTGHDCGRGAIRRTVQSSNRDLASRTTNRKSNQDAYNKSLFGSSDEYSARDFLVDQDYNYADYINICASSYAASNPAESDNFSGYRSPNISRYGNLNSPGFGDSGEHSYETEPSAIHEAPVNPEHGTIQTPTYSTSGTGYSGGGDPTSLSFSSPVSPSHGIQHTSSGFNTPGYDVPGWSDHRAPYSSPYEGPRSLIYAAPEISSYNKDLPENSSSHSFNYAALGSSAFIAPGSSSAYDVSASSRYGVPGLTGNVPSRSSNYEVSASAHYGLSGYSTYGPSPSSSWTSGSSGSEYGTFVPSGYSAPISASYGAPELFDYRTSNSYGYSTHSTPFYDVPAYFGYSGDYSSFGYFNIGSSGYSASMAPGYDVSSSAGYGPPVSSTYSTTYSSSFSSSLAPDYGTLHATHRGGSVIPSSSVSGNLGSSDNGISNLSVFVPVSSHYGPPAFSGFGASSPRHGISRASRYGAPSMARSSRSGVGLGPQTKIDKGTKPGDNKAKKIDSSLLHIAPNRGPFDLGIVPSVGTAYPGFGPIAEAIARDQGAGPVPGPGYGRGRAVRRGQSPTFGPIVPLQEIDTNRGRAQMSQYGPSYRQRPLIEEITPEPEQTGRGRGHGRGRGRRDANGN